MNDIIPPHGGETRLPNGRFAPGHGGRPKGSKNKAGRAIKEAIERSFEREAASGGMTKLQQAIDKQVDAAAGGDLNALIFLFAYMAGKPKQMKEDTGSDPLGAQLALLEFLRQNPESDYKPGADAEIEGVADDKS